MLKTMPLYVSLTTTPSRLVHIRATLDSLFTQTLTPDRVFLIVPMQCDREPGGYDIPSWIHDYEPRLQIVRPTHDSGPGTKLLGCLSEIHEPACLVLVDDDMAYQPEFLAHLYVAQVAELSASFSYYVYSWGAVQSIGQGVDGFSIYTPHLHGVREWAEGVIQCPSLRVHDDLWISVYLQNAGVTVKNVREHIPEPGPSYIPGLGHDLNQLHNLQGELARDKVTERGVHYLVSHGYMGRWLQVDHHVRSLIKRMFRAGLGWIRRSPKEQNAPAA